MPEQLAFAGFHPTPRADRLFFAVLPDRNATTAAAALTRRLVRAYGLTGRPIAPERLHVSLHGLARTRPLADLVAAADAAAADLAHPAFEVVFDWAVSFGTQGNRPIVVFGDDGVVGLFMLAEALGEALHRVGFARPPPAWTPHMTLLYDRIPVPEQPVEPIRWRVRELVLVRSLVGQSRHVILGRWPIGG